MIGITERQRRGSACSLWFGPSTGRQSGTVSLLPSDLEDLGRFGDELAACRGGGERPGGPVDDGESGGCFDLVEHLCQGAGASVVRTRAAAAMLSWPGMRVISSSRVSAPLRMVTARRAGEGGLGRLRWPMTL